MLSLCYLMIFYVFCLFLFFFFFKQKTAYEMRISDWSSDVCSSDLVLGVVVPVAGFLPQRQIQNLRRLDFLIAIILVDRAHVLFDLLPQGPAFGVPENKPRRLVLEVEQVQLATQLAMVAPLGLFQNRSEEHTSELQSLMRIPYAVSCLTTT